MQIIVIDWLKICIFSCAQLLLAPILGRDTTTAADQSTWDELNREMAQLERQQANLRSVLAPMRQHDWPSR
jgi:hypothetical protein